MNRTRKSNLKDKIEGCLEWTREMFFSILDFDIDGLRFNFIMFCETAKGNFEVVENE